MMTMMKEATEVMGATEGMEVRKSNIQQIQQIF